MLTARHDAAILGTLTATVALFMGLASPSYGRIPVAPMEHHAVLATETSAPHTYPVYREPAAPIARATTNSRAPEASSPVVRGVSEHPAESTALYESPGSRNARVYFEDWNDYGYWADNNSWNLHYFHRRNEWRRQYFERRERLRRSQLYDLLASGDAGSTGDANTPIERRIDACSVFSRACGGSRSATPVAPTASQHVAALSRHGSIWTLDNDLSSVTIDPERLCALTVSANEPSDGLSAPPTLRFTTPEPAERCELIETGTTDGVGVAINWEGSGWSQRAIVSLRDEARGPEATVSVVRVNDDGHNSTFLANLTGEAMEWAIDGHTVVVAPGAMARVRR